MNHIAITGIGMISAIGNNAAQVLAALKSEQSGIALPQYLHTGLQLPVGEVKLSNDALRHLLHVPAESHWSRSSLMGTVALGEALQQSGLMGRVGEFRTAFISGTTVAGMDQTEQCYADILAGNAHQGIYAIHECGACTEQQANYYGGFAMVDTISTACSSALNAMIEGAELIRTGRCDIAVVGGTEALSRYHLNGFNSLLILDKEPCRPLDDTRAGLNLGEGAGYIVLEREDVARRRGANILCYLAGWGNACDAFHQTASSADGEGAYLAMQQAIDMAGIETSQVNYINLHGTGTENNDVSEGVAIQRLFGARIPLVSSTKSYTGHATSAAGALESVISILALTHKFIPPTLRWRHRIPSLRFTPVSRVMRNVELNCVMNNSFGFGGNDSSVIFTRTLPEQSRAVTLDAPATDAPICYVASVQQISTQTPLSDAWMEQPVLPQGPIAPAADPNFKHYLSPAITRRLNGLMKRALVTATTALSEAEVTTPDAIIATTGCGSVCSTEQFMFDMFQNGEQMLKPTPFMMSTHNTMGSQIAIYLHDHGYNNTHSHGTVSFEVALLDALLQYQTSSIQTLLLGAYDEITDNHYKMFQSIGYDHRWNFASDTSVSAVLTRQSTPQSLCAVWGMELLYQPTPQQLEQTLVRLQALWQWDAVVDGRNGQPANDANYAWFEALDGKPRHTYKQWLGDSYTASAYGFYYAAHLLQRSDYRRLVMYHTDGYRHSFILLGHV